MTNLSPIFISYTKIKIPRPLRVICTLLILFFLIMIVSFVYVPWVQTSYTTGRVISLSPNGQLQAIHALVKGRIQKWHVRDGAMVKKGDVIVDIIDNDPMFVARLQSQKNSFMAAKNAATIATQTALLNVNRQESLHAGGLASRKDIENARIKYKSWLAKQSQAESKIADAETKLSRQTRQKIIAPQDGQIVRTFAGDTATFVKEGTVLAEFMPINHDIAIALDVPAIDMPLIREGQYVRLQFEGWPIIQFSGWPKLSMGTFGGRVKTIDSAISENGTFRVIISRPLNEAWPEPQWLRFGVRTKGWIQLGVVSLGYEIWRKLNGFPPDIPAVTVSKNKKK